MCIFAAPAAAAAGSGISFGAAASLPALGVATAAPAVTLPAGIFTGAAASSIPFAAGIGAPLGIASAGATATSSFLGLGSAAKPFLARTALGLGTNLLAGASARRIANQQAQYAYEAARKGAEAADLAFSREVEATAAKLKEEKADGSINTSAFPKGSYILKLLGENGAVSTKKFKKE